MVVPAELPALAFNCVDETVKPIWFAVGDAVAAKDVVPPALATIATVLKSLMIAKHEPPLAASRIKNIAPAAAVPTLVAVLVLIVTVLVWLNPLSAFTTPLNS